MKRSSHKRKRSSQQLEIFNNCFDQNKLGLEWNVESLESREMLAGEVSVAVAGDNLVFKGDSGDNELILYVSGGTIWVNGEGGTTLTGDATSNIFDTEISEDNLNKLTVKLIDGNNKLQILGVDIHGKAKIATGNGDDIVDVYGGGSSAAKMVINTAGGNDQLYANDWTFDGAVKAKLGAGVDYAYVGNGANTVYFNSKTVLNMGTDNDTVVIGGGLDTPVGGSVSVNGSGGEDTLDSGAPNEATAELASGAAIKNFELFV